MKNILLTTTALIAFAGAAAADGHTSFTWGGAATAGVAREGAVAGTAAVKSTATATEVKNFLAGAGNWVTTAPAGAATGVITAAELKAERADAAAQLVLDLAAADLLVTVARDADIAAANDAYAARIAALDYVGGTLATAAVAALEFDTYAEVNITATGSVDLGNGVTVSGAVSVDAGTGYDMADDDGFDAAKTNGVALDYIKVDGGTMGALTIDKNDIAHLVDGDDDTNGDIKYTNTFGNANIAFVMDTLKDTDETAAYAGADSIAAAASTGVAIGDFVAGSAAVAADVSWSAKVGYVINDSMSVYAAFDEEKGNAFGGSYSMNGMTVSVDSKLEALEAAEKADRSNTISGSYAVAGFTAGASYNSIVDGNQWGINAGYSADGMSIAFDTDEASQWTATASYAFNDAASVEAGVNYTEDAFVGVSFKF